MAGGSKFLTINPGTMPATGTAYSLAMRGSDTYGGMTVLGAWVQTSVVGTLNVALVNYGTSGTVAGGTVAGMASGTATVWAAEVPQAMAVTAANAFIDSGEYVRVKKVESAASNDLSEDATILIEYVDGIVVQG
jgi:hypothetical protein